MSVSLVVVREALEAAVSSGSSHVYGVVRSAEGLIQVLSADPLSGYEVIGSALPSESRASGIRFDLECGPVSLVLRAGLQTPERTEMVPLGEGLDSRRSVLVGQAGLRAKQVLLVGAGSVGSMVGLLLAEAGVGRFLVLDNDRLDASNLSRHACDLSDLGREKAAALADLLQRRGVRAEGRNVDVLVLPDAERDRLVGQSDLTVASTDSPPVQFITNDALVRAGKPGLFTGAYELAAGGEIIPVRPGQGPCYYCVAGFRTGVLAGLDTKERRPAYQATGQDQMTAEPGLGVDIAFLSAVAAAHALALLDPGGSRADLLKPGRFLLVHGGGTPRGNLAELFGRPFEFVSARVVRDEPCPVCAWSSGSHEQEGVDNEGR